MYYTHTCVYIYVCVYTCIHVLHTHVVKSYLRNPKEAYRPNNINIQGIVDLGLQATSREASRP